MTLPCAKPLIPNKEWIVETNGVKLGTLSKKNQDMCSLLTALKLNSMT